MTVHLAADRSVSDGRPQCGSRLMAMEGMFSNRSPLLTLALVGGAWCLTSLLILHFCPDPFTTWNNRVYDWKALLLMSTPKLHSRVVHVDVDDQAIKPYGAWPWNRSMSARIVTRLRELGARVVVLDIIYSAPGKNENEREGDKDLCEAIAAAGNVVVAVAPIRIGKGSKDLVFPRGRERVDGLYERALVSEASPGFDFFRIEVLRDSGLPLLPIINQARALGHILATPDQDGVFRRVPMLLRLGDRYLPSLSLSTLTTLLDVDPSDVDLKIPGRIRISHLQGTLSIPVDTHGNLLIKWRPYWTSFKHYSVLDILNDEPDPEREARYKDKIVIVASAWTGSSDLGSTPLESEVLLSRVHSCALATVLSGEFIHILRPFPHIAIVAVLASAVVLWVSVRSGMRSGIVLALIIPAAFGVFVLLAFKRASLEVPSVQPLFIFVPTVVLGFTALAIWSEKEREMVRETFGRYLSEEIVTEILKSPGGVNLNGELREVALLVTDLRGFTPMTESLPPQTVVKVINRYLERMIDIVGTYGGVIDEFTGDGILAFFGAPRPLPDHIRCAVACALEMQESMVVMNQENVDSGLPELRMGIGITSGRVIVGNIGSEKRKKYGATGKAVNLAFRIEAQTVGAEILVGPNVYEALGEQLIIDSEREVDLKGIEQPVKLYRVMGMKS